MKNYGSLSPKLGNLLLHGGDYNPDQWLDYPEVLKQDLVMMKKAGVNVVSLGIFAWSTLEPEEGVFNFEWMDKIIDDLWANGVYVVLATPSGARPRWLAQKYPEVLRVNERFERQHFGIRHNHCPTSPAYREKVRIINTKLAERYAKHPAVVMWHISNEYCGECRCPLCVSAFQKFMKKRFGTIEKLNHDLWNHFWSYAYNDFDQIEPPSEIGEGCCPGLFLNWKRFNSEQTTNFMLEEIAAVKAVAPEIPCTTNMMRNDWTLDYFRMAKELDIVSWDSYPEWHFCQSSLENRDETVEAAAVSMWHDMYRSMGEGRPFILMESVPSVSNALRYGMLKRPGVHQLSSLHAVAHGADSIQYFQWRKGRGGHEKFHGAVVSHDGRDDTRVFCDVASLGKDLKELAAVSGTGVNAKVAVFFDWENRWSIAATSGPRNAGMNYTETVTAHHRALWALGITTDFVYNESDLSKYDLVIAPMLYLLPETTAKRLSEFVEKGGTLVGTYHTGIVNEDDLCYLGEKPLDRLFGVVAEEIDTMPEGINNPISWEGHDGHYACEMCELCNLDTAKVLASYTSDFYAGMPVLTKNQYGEGTAYYIAARTDYEFLKELYAKITEELSIEPAMKELPYGVSAVCREDEEHRFLFVMNFTAEQKEIILETPGTDLLTKNTYEDKLLLPPYGTAVLV